ncbi:MAG: amidohydrolase family protein [Acidobacteriota bacterium]
MLADTHCHFFSPGFFRTLGADASQAAAGGDPAESLPKWLGWDAPATDEALADRWIAELDRHQVDHAMLIASVPGDEASVSTAVRRKPGRIVGAFMFNPAVPDSGSRLERAFGELGLRTACLFPAMHRVPVDDDRSVAVFKAAERRGAAVFVHCGLLSIGIRRKLGLPSQFDLRLGDPLAVAAVAVRHPSVPVIIPHFGAGLFREALMAALTAPNILLDTSSSNDWVRLHSGLTLRDVFARALEVLGPDRLVFGTDSSFFPRGWQRGVFDIQRAILEDLGVAPAAQAQIFGGNFARMFGAGSTSVP